MENITYNIYNPAPSWQTPHFLRTPPAFLTDSSCLWGLSSFLLTDSSHSEDSPAFPTDSSPSEDSPSLPVGILTHWGLPSFLTDSSPSEDSPSPPDRLHIPLHPLLPSFHSFLFVLFFSCIFLSPPCTPTVLYLYLNLVCVVWVFCGYLLMLVQHYYTLLCSRYPGRQSI